MESGCIDRERVNGAIITRCFNRIGPSCREVNSVPADVDSMKRQLIRTDLLNIVRAVHQGLKHVQPDVAIQLASHAAGEMLSLREVQVLELIAAGNSNKLIGAQLFINEETVKGYIKRIFSKLQARDRTHAVMIGLRRGIIRI
jgi:DNA-binding NarL/FixJ family response regulator